MRISAAVMIFVLILTLPVTSADWLQEGGDAARTGVAEGSGLAWDDVAFTVQLPWTPDGGNVVPTPIILGRTVYVMLPGSLQHPTLQGDFPGSIMYAVDLDDPKPVEVARYEWPLYHLASDGKRLFAGGDHRVVAWDMGSSTPVWDPFVYILPPEFSSQLSNYPDEKCGPPAVTADRVVIACKDPHSIESGDFLLAVIDAENGTLARPWTTAEAHRPVEPCDPNSNNALSCIFEHALGNYLPALSGSRVPRVSVVADTAYLPYSHRYVLPVQGISGGDPPSSYGGYDLFAFSLANSTAKILEQSVGLVDPTLTMQRGTWLIPTPTGTEEYVFTKSLSLRRYDAAAPVFMQFDAAPIRSTPAGAELDLGSGFALRGDRLYVTTYTRLLQFNLEMEPDPVFVPPTLPDGEAFDEGGLVIAGDVLVARATQVSSFGRLATDTIIYAFDANTGATLWRHSFEGQTRIAASDGLVVAMEENGLLTVLGTTAASPLLRADVDSAYPATSSLVEVDVAAQGGLGSTWEFKADWGDGTITPWQTAPSFQQRYAEGVDQHARFFVRNDAGQTASVPMTFHVGQDDPAVNIFNSPFSDKYQETSFFVFGLLATGIAALIGLYRAGSKRRRLHRELRDLEADVKALRGTDECESMLAQRRARARSLFLEKKLEEAHASFLEKRIDEVQRSIRVGAVDEQLRFLSHGLVLRLKRLLADARVDALERVDFMDALEKERLPQKQRDQVRRLVESWFLRDEEVRA